MMIVARKMRKYLFGLTVFALAFGILSITLVESASVNYVLAAQSPDTSPSPIPQFPRVEYTMPIVGSIHPDSPLWTIKAAGDRIQFLTTFDHLERAEKALFFADERLVSSVELVERKPGVALVTLSKSGKYLEVAVEHELEARKNGHDTTEFLKKLATSSLAHRQVIEEKILPFVSEQGRPIVVKTEDYAKNAYKSANEALALNGKQGPKSPFDSH